MGDMELKPCPFCGGRALFKTVSSTASHYSAVFSFKVECGKCGTSLPRRYSVVFGLSVDGVIKPDRDERCQAAEAWNKRA